MKQITLELNTLMLVDVLSIATACMLGFLFITLRSSNKRANLFLGLFLWSLAFEVIDAFLANINFPENSVYILQTSLITIPWLFLYLKTTLHQRVSYFVVVLFIPFVIANLFHISEELQKYFGYLFHSTLLIYMLFILRHHQKNIVHFYADLAQKTFSWLQTIIYIFLFFNLLWIVEDLVGFQNENLTTYFAYASTILTFLMIYWIGYNGFSQSEMFTTPLVPSEYKVAPTSVAVADTKPQFEDLVATIKEQKIYLDPTLDLRTLSLKVAIKERELSKLIKQHTDHNFYHFINQFRVDQFKHLLTSPKAKQLSILGLAEEAGFASKSTFYTAFKKLTGLTPKQYQNHLKKSE